MSDGARVVIGLGANLGDRLGTLREAALRIEGIADVRARSRVYETMPVGGPLQPSFLNAALVANCNLSPLTLLDALQRIEAALGRSRTDEVRWGPRTIDLDILWIEGCMVDEPRLVVPHPRLRERAFALVPMLELVPDALDPGTATKYAVPADGSGIHVTDLTLG